MRTDDPRTTHTRSLPVFLLLCVGAVVVALGYQGAQARWIAPASPNLPLPSIRVVDEDDRPVSLDTALRASGTGPALIAPAYARCQSSCPDLVRPLARGVRELGESEAPRVVVFFFDSAETTSEVRAFRARHGVPATWLLLRAADERATRAFFDAYSLRVMQQGGGYAHPSEILVLDEALRWSGGVPNASLTTSVIEDALERTHAPWWRAVLSRPATWLRVGAIGLGTGVALLIFILLRMWRGGRADSGPRGAHP